MSPTNEPQSRVVYRDPNDRVELTHPYIAAAVIIAGHAMIQVIPGRGHALFIFARDAQPAVDRLKRSVDEVLAHLERATQAQRRQTRARS
jgi:hypothetical protein